MALLETVVLLDVMKVVSSHDACAKNCRRKVNKVYQGKKYIPLHLQGLDNTSQDAATNADIASEGALLVNVWELACLNEAFEPHS